MDDPAKTNPPVTSSLPSMGEDTAPPMPIVTTPTGGDMQSAAPRKKFGTGKIIAAIFGVLLLVGGAVAGVLLVQQQQEIREKAAGATCYSTDIANGCTFAQNPTHCWRATTNNACLVNGQPEGTLEVFSGPGAYDGQVCYTCPSNSDEPGVVKCSGANSVETNPNCGAPPGETITPTPRLSVCGESCTVDNDCAGSTFPGINVVCRAGQCVNQQCYDAGKTTEFGTICSCKEATGTCGEPCGADIGLCAAGFSCTYKAQSQCTPGTQGVCIPGTPTTPGNTGPLTGIPLYQGTAFESRKCGSGTADPQNNYLYHASFPNHTFTNAEVNQYICNPTPPSGQCLNVVAYNTSWVKITNLATLKVGDTVRFVVKGSATEGTFDKARFTINSATRPEVTQKRPGTTDEFYDEYTILTGTTRLTIQAELHHTTLGWF